MNGRNKKLVIIILILLTVIIFFIYYDYLFHQDNLFRKIHYYSYKIDKMLHPEKYEKTEASKINELKVITFNIWSGLDYKGTLKMGWYEEKKIREKRYNLLIDSLKKIDADIIVLNEVNNLPWFARKIAKSLGYDYISYTGVSGLKIGPFGLPINLKEGDVILTKKKYGLEFMGRIRLEKKKGYVGNLFSLHTDDATQAIIGKIIAAGKSYIVINTHLHASLINDEATNSLLSNLRNKYKQDINIVNNIKNEIIKEVKWRQDSINILIDYIKDKFPNEKIILCGDFNTTYKTTEIEKLKDYGFYSSYINYYKMKGIDLFKKDIFGNLINKKIDYFTWNPDTNLNIIKYYKTPFINKEKDLLNSKKVKLTVNIFKSYSDLQKRKIDYIFLKNIEKSKIIESKVIFNTPIEGLNLSDHYGVLTVISVE